jgi:hypothetical protein
MVKLINKTVFLVLLIFIISAVFVNSFNPATKFKNNDGKKYALLVGGGTTDFDTYDSFYKNIEYVSNTLIKLGYCEEYIKILFYGGKKPDRPIVDRNSTKKILLDELSYLENTINPNDSLVIFRSGHGIIDLVFKNYESLSNIKNVSVYDRLEIVGITAVMIFPDGGLTCHEFQERLARIKAKQIVVILNQCFSGQFTDMALKLNNAVIISQTDFAMHQTRKTLRWKHDEWPFVKCFFDGFLHKGKEEKKQSVYNAFQYMLKCNPNIEGIPIKADRPLLKENPQIKYGMGLKIGTVYIE